MCETTSIFCLLTFCYPLNDEGKKSMADGVFVFFWGGGGGKC